MPLVSLYALGARHARTRYSFQRNGQNFHEMSEDRFVIEPFPISRLVLHPWRFGYWHPTSDRLAALAHDRDTDCVYIFRTYKRADARIAEHAHIMRKINPHMPWAYSHDADSREHGSGDAIADQYRKEGVIMTPTHAQFETGGYSVQASIMDMVQRLEDDRLKISLRALS